MAPNNCEWTDNLVIDESTRIALMKNEHRAHVLRFLRAYYYPEEPLTVGREPKQQEEADEEFQMGQIFNRTSMMVLHKNNDVEDIIGVAISGGKLSDEADHINSEVEKVGATSKWGTILKFLGHIEREANVWDRYLFPHVLHVHVLAVHPAFRGRGLGAKLLEEVIKVGKGSGYGALTIDCTSMHSARVCERLNMELIHMISYKDYTDKDGNQVFKPPSEHDAVRTYAFRLMDASKTYVRVKCGQKVERVAP